MSYPANALPEIPARRVPYPTAEQRKAFRRDVREQVAKESLTQRRRSELQAAINEIEGQKEAAAADHVAACKPIQARLATIQEEQIAEIADRTPKSPKLEAERLQLQGQLDEHNTTLAEVIRRCDDKLQPLVEELRKIPFPSPPSIIENRLIGYGDPAKQDALWSACIASWWLSQRLNTASGHLEKLVSLRDAQRRSGVPDGELKGANEEIRKFQSEVAAAGKALAASRADEERLRAELVNE